MITDYFWIDVVIKIVMVLVAMILMASVSWAHFGAKTVGDWTTAAGYSS